MKTKAFSLFEVLIVATILSIIAVVVLPMVFKKESEKTPPETNVEVTNTPTTTTSQPAAKTTPTPNLDRLIKSNEELIELYIVRVKMLEGMKENLDIWISETKDEKTRKNRKIRRDIRIVELKFAKEELADEKELIKQWEALRDMERNGKSIEAITLEARETMGKLSTSIQEIADMKTKLP